MHTYDWLVLRSIVVIGYLGWMSTAATFILRHFVFSDQPELLGSSPLKLWQMAVATIPLLFIASNFSFESTPLSYWVYLGFAAYLTFLTIRDLKPLQLLFVKASRQPKDSASTAFAVFAVLETMVVGYFQRQTWFAGMTLLAVSGWFWLESHGKKVIWTILCLLTGSFTLFDVEREESMLLV